MKTLAVAMIISFAVLNATNESEACPRVRPHGIHFVGHSSMLAPHVGRPNLLKNNSFERGLAGEHTVSTGAQQSIPDWEVFEGDVDHLDAKANPAWGPAHGFRFLDLSGVGGLGAIRQMISTKPSRRYILQFELAGNLGSDEVKTLQVEAGSEIHKITVHRHPDWDFDNLQWRRITIEFVATGPQTPIIFRSLDSGVAGPFLDNVCVYAR